MSDNRLDSSIFESTFSLLYRLSSVNFSHNDIFDIPNGSLASFSTNLRRLYLSGWFFPLPTSVGNKLTQLPDDLYACKALKLLYINNNKLVSLPAELGKLVNLRVLDASCNQLRYNIGNFVWTRLIAFRLLYRGNFMI